MQGGEISLKMDDKKTLRKIYLEKRQSLSKSERNKLDDLLLIQLQKLALPDATVLFNYVPMEAVAEPNTYLFSRYFQFILPDLAIAYPVANMKTASFEAYLTDEDTEFEERKFGLIEPISSTKVDPKDIDIIIVPLIVADEKGYRVGFGKGMYDNFLAKCRPDALKIGICYFEPIVGISDLHQNDIPLDVLITPMESFTFD